MNENSVNIVQNTCINTNKTIDLVQTGVYSQGHYGLLKMDTRTRLQCVEKYKVFEGIHYILNMYSICIKYMFNIY